jgi:uncharacterized membrane protein YcaP (DUF421 family)
VLEDIRRPLLDGLLPMFTLVAIQVTIAFLCLRSQKLRRWFDGNPSVLIENGKLNRKEMARQRYNLNDLLLQLRENRIVNVADVEFAILEPSGKLTTLTKQQLGMEEPAAAVASRESSARQNRGEPLSDESQNDTLSAAKPGPAQSTQPSTSFGAPNFRYEGLPLPLIMDGKVQDDSLEKLGKTRFWLKNEIQGKGVREFKDVFFCSIDHRGRIFLDRKR